MKKTEILAYTAGIIDGEGCIVISKKRKDLQVQVNITSQWIVQWLQLNYGGSTRCKRKNHPVWKDIWSWAISANQALSFLTKIIPYLQIKRPQAELAIRFQTNRPHCHVRKDEKAKAVLEAERILMNNLNKRGRG